MFSLFSVFDIKISHFIFLVEQIFMNGRRGTFKFIH